MNALMDDMLHSICHVPGLYASNLSCTSRRLHALWNEKEHDFERNLHHQRMLLFKEICEHRLIKHPLEMFVDFAFEDDEPFARVEDWSLLDSLLYKSSLTPTGFWGERGDGF